MIHKNLEQLLEDLPIRRLHSLARGKVHRHFRMGKQRIIEFLLQLPPQHRSSLEAEIQSLESHRQLAHTLPKQVAIKDKIPPSEARSTPKPSGRSLKSDPPTTEAALLEGIGIPPPREFIPDPWQLEAIAHLETSDVIVSVPTGSGKTFVAVEATKRAMQRDCTVIYTSPLKALSNTKYMEFSHLFGQDQVGILTGDRRENAQAPLLIMTTEILRNLLYDAASGEIDIRLNTLGLVILDESQFLADPERGVVWEETIIFCPSQAHLLLLSASFGNPEELVAWLQSIRSVPCHLIHHRQRSVPLRGAYLHPSGKLAPLFKTRDIALGHGYVFHPETKQLFSQYEQNTLGPQSRRRDR